MSRKTAISLLLSTGLIASCTTVTPNKAEINTVTANKAGIATATADNTKTDTVDPDNNDKAIAIQAMHNMSAYLRSLRTFKVTADINFDQVLDNGQKILLNKSVEVRAEQPSKLWMNSTMMDYQREFFFNGKTFTLFAPNLGYYASFDAPATIGKTVIKAEQQYGIEWPLADLFLWGTKDDNVTDVNAAIIIGVDQVDGISCNHFAFREKDIDWQICIQRGEKPLPLQLVITEKNAEAEPQYVARMKWNTTPALSKQNYTFSPHEGDHKIKFSNVTAENITGIKQ